MNATLFPLQTEKSAEKQSQQRSLPTGPPSGSRRPALLIQETATLAPVTVEGAAGQVMHY